MNKLFWNFKSWFFKSFRSGFPFGTILNKENENLILLLDQAKIEGKTVVDVGVGTGNVVRFLNKSKRVFGIDFTFSMLEKFHIKFPVVDIIQADALCIPLKSESVDVITAVGLIEYIKDAIPFFEESCRILKNNGYLVLTFSPANIWTWMRVLLGHPLYSRKLDQITGVANLCSFKTKDFRQSMMQHQVLMQKVTVKK